MVKRYSAALLALMLLALLAGCARIEAAAGVDAGNNAYISYRFECDTTEQDDRMREGLRSGIEGLAAYYTELGFEEQHSFDGSMYWLEVTRTERRGSLEEAFDHLREMMQDESISLFANVDLAFEAGEYHTAYVANVSFNPTQILDTVALSGLPHDLLDQYDEAVEEMTASLTLTIPGTEIVEASGGPEQLAGFVQAKTSGGTGKLSVSLATILSSDDAQAIRDSLQEQEPDDGADLAAESAARLRLVLLSVCILSFFIILACIAVFVDSLMARGRGEHRGRR